MHSNCKPGLLVTFVKRKALLVNGVLVNAESAAEDVFYLLKSRILGAKPSVSKQFFVEHVASLLTSYGERLLDTGSDSMLFHEVMTLFSQACEGDYYDAGKSSFDSIISAADQESDNETDFVLLVGSTA